MDGVYFLPVGWSKVKTQRSTVQSTHGQTGGTMVVLHTDGGKTDTGILGGNLSKLSKYLMI